jgi:SulP family sulfate permease
MPDIWGGLAAMLVALPSAIAFGVLVFSSIAPELAGQGALTGMLGAAAMGLVAPLAGRTPGLISAPCAPAAAVLSGLALGLVQTGLEPARIIGLLGLTTLLAAILQLTYGALKGGRLIKYIPYPVVSGYLSGVGIIIVIGQLPKFFGLPAGDAHLAALLAPGDWQWPAIVVGSVTAACMLGGPLLTRKAPPAILGLGGGIVCYLLLSFFLPALQQLDGNGLVIGPIRLSGSFTGNILERFSLLGSISVNDLELVAYSALALSVLLSIDTLKTCVVLDALTRNRHNSNRELLGQGIANLVTFITGGMSGAGTMGPTLVNVTSGGRSMKSGMAEGISVLLVILLLSPLVAWVPISALAAVLLVVAFRMIDWQSFRLLMHRETRFDFAVIATVVLVAETVGLIAASGTGIGLAILLFIRDQIRSSVLRRCSSLETASSKTRRLEDARELLRTNGSLGGIYELQGNLFFGTTDQLFTELEPDLATRKWALFDLRRGQTLDYTAAHLFTQMHQRLKEKGGGILFCGFPSSKPEHQDIETYLARLGLIRDESSGIRIFEMRDEALEWMENAILAEAGWVGKTDESTLDLQDMELLSGMSQENISKLRACVSSAVVENGKSVFHYGDRGDEMYFISRGQVVILLPLPGGKRHHLATFGQGDFFGEMAFLDGESRSADAVARGSCIMFVLTRKDFDRCVTNQPELGAELFARLSSVSAKRLRKADSELRILEDH